MIILSILGFIVLMLLALYLLVVGITITIGGAFFGGGFEGIIPLIAASLVALLACYLSPFHIVIS